MNCNIIIFLVPVVFASCSSIKTLTVKDIYGLWQCYSHNDVSNGFTFSLSKDDNFIWKYSGAKNESKIIHNKFRFFSSDNSIILYFRGPINSTRGGIFMNKSYMQYDEIVYCRKIK